MKGLLIKDFMLLKNQKQFFGVITCICIFFLVTSQNLSFVVSYMTIVLSLFTVNTLIYDQQDKGMGYIFTLPVSRRSYVREKYILGILMEATAIIVIGIIAAVVLGIKDTPVNIEEAVATLIGSVLSTTLMISVMLPVQLKFGAERSQTAVLVVVAGAFILAFVEAKTAEAFGVDIIDILDAAIEASAARAAVMCSLIGIAAMGISYLVSNGIMKKKEF